MLRNNIIYWAKELFGKFAYLNKIPDEQQPIITFEDDSPEPIIEFE